ncbi:MAG: hypothetical protein AB7P03_04320 [Kofleriaceae bacterium]
MMRALGLISFAVLCSCSDYTVITVDTRPAVHDPTAIAPQTGASGVAELRVTLTNGGDERIETLSLGGSSFPVDFSYSSTDLSGDVRVQVEALTANGTPIGHGVAVVPASTGSARLILDGADFVVNTTYAGDQMLAGDDDDSGGFQLASNDDGTWTVVFRESCSTCDMFARRFDKHGYPLVSSLASPDPRAQFKLSTATTMSTSTPAVAATPTRLTLAVWDTNAGVLCRGIDDTGADTTGALQISTDGTSDVVSLAPLANNNFAVAWRGYDTKNVIRTMIIRPFCTALTTPVVTSTSNGTAATRPSVATNGSRVLYAWILDGSVHIRAANESNEFDTTTDVQLIAKTASEQIKFVRVTPASDGGFALFARWATIDEAGTGKITMYRLGPTGALLGQGTDVAVDTKADNQSVRAFGVATRRPDMSMFVTWHTCAIAGCDVFGRFIAADGRMIGDVIAVATTTGGDQINPSVTGLPEGVAIAWRDDSHQSPDALGGAVRARILSWPAE